jgi:SAM-dependent methyltransferase
VEIPIALGFLGRGRRVLEVGNVLRQYAPVPDGYTVVDKYERGAGVINRDVLDVTETFDLIVSISTLEHIGLDEHPREPGKAAAAVSHLRSLLAPGGAMLATWALCYNRDLDEAPLEDSLGGRQSGTYSASRDRTSGPK